MADFDGRGHAANSTCSSFTRTAWVRAGSPPPSLSLPRGADGANGPGGGGADGAIGQGSRRAVGAIGTIHDSAAHVARIPPGVAFEDAAAFPVPALTADRAVSDALRVRSGQTILVNGAGGVTGGLVVQLAAARGARSDARDAIRAVKDGGRLATITGDPPPAERGITVAAPDGARLGRLIALLGRGALTISIAARYPLGQAAAALAAARRGSHGAARTAPRPCCGPRAEKPLSLCRTNCGYRAWGL